MNDMFSSHNDSEPRELPVEIEAWLNEEAEPDAAALKEVWQLAGHARSFDLPAEPDAVRFERMRREVKAAAHPGRLRLVSRQVFRMAAVILVLLLAGVVWWTRPVTYDAPLAGRLSIHLEDGTEISLNSGSRLTHRRSFGRGARNVTLRGEAFFDVAHGDAPFTVQTFNGSVTVLGTRFNVRAWESDDTPETEVVLEEGSVRLAAAASSQDPVILRPGQVSRIAGHAARPSLPESVDVDRSIVWRRGGFLFVDKQVGVVIDEVERRFGIEIQAAPRSLRQDLVSLKLDDARTAEDVLATIATVRGYRFERAGDAYRLTKN